LSRIVVAWNCIVVAIRTDLCEAKICRKNRINENFFLFLSILLASSTNIALNNVEDPRLKDLAKAISGVLERSRAESTLKKYECYFKRWSTWCDIFKEIDDFPAQSIYVALFLTSLVQQNESFSVIESVFYAIKHFHVVASVPDPTSSNLTRYILEAAKRICDRPTRKKEPLTFANLMDIYKKIGMNTCSLVNLRTFTLMVLSYAAFFRYSEASNLTLGDLIFQPSYLKIFIEKSKTDQYREGHWVHIARTSSVICPVRMVQLFIERAQIVEHTEYLFRATTFFKSRNQHCLRKSNKPISYTTARSNVLELIRKIGLNEKLFGLHSLRSGGATAAARNGVPDRLFKNHGRWKSEKVKDGYVKDKLEDILKVTLCLG